MTMDTKVRIKPSKGAGERALACAILSREDGISIHTKAALESSLQEAARRAGLARGMEAGRLQLFREREGLTAMTVGVAAS